MERQTQYKGLRNHSKETNLLVRECLKKALILLSEEQAYDEITITALCKRAGVSRMAFYRNYGIINDIFTEMVEDLKKEIVKRAGSPLISESGLEWYEKVFTILEENRDTILFLWKKDTPMGWIRTENLTELGLAEIDTNAKYMRTIWSGGFERAIGAWLNSRAVIPPKQMAEYCAKYLPQIPLR